MGWARQVSETMKASQQHTISHHAKNELPVTGVTCPPHEKHATRPSRDGLEFEWEAAHARSFRAEIVCLKGAFVRGSGSADWSEIKSPDRTTAAPRNPEDAVFAVWEAMLRRA